MAETLSYTGTLVVETCWCGMRHAIPQTLRDHMNAQHEKGQKQIGIYCPLGHSWIFSGKSEVEKVKERLEREQSRTAALTAEKDQLEASRRALKGQVTKIKKRIGKGVCPCCNRHFVNVERHMATQHPEVAEVHSSSE